MDDDDVPGEIDFDWVEQQIREQEMSSMFAAQRDPYDDEEGEDEEDSPEEEPEEAEPVSSKEVQRAQKGSSPAKTEKLTDSRPSHIDIGHGDPIKKDDRVVGKAVSTDLQGRPYDEYFPKYPLLGQRQTTVTLRNGDRRFCGLSAVSAGKDSSSTSKRSVIPSKDSTKWGSKIDAKTFGRIEGEVDLQVAVERKVAETIESSEAHMLPRKPKAAMEDKSKRIPLVQKYLPSKFMDLLSHERKNREALKWLRSFDKEQPEGVFIPKVLLLAGPPGSGKTTMAHVLARHAGYRVVEINASDERSAAGLKEKIASATEMKSVFDQDGGRYNLVVLDEIDGVSDGVQAVVQYATNANGGNVRPLLCTCNDAYAPALRPLRRISMVLNIALPSRARLVKRLREICLSERVDYRPGALEMLVERMDDDVRASLNALDFWMRSYRHGGKEEEMATSEDGSSKPRAMVLNVEAVRSLPAFAKDGTADLWATWKQILHHKRSASSSSSSSRPLSTSSRMSSGRGGADGDDLLSTVSRHMGDLDLMVDGVHENFLRNRFTDPAFTKTHKAYEWLSFVDVMQTRSLREMDFSFTSYCAAGLVGVGRMVQGGVANTKLIFPSSAAAFRNSRMRNIESLNSFFENPLTRTLNRREFPVETVSMLLRVLTPKLRPIPLQAMSLDEKKEAEKVVAIMDELGLNWMEQSESGAFQSRMNNNNKGGTSSSSSSVSLDPAVDKLATFSGLERPCGTVSADFARAINARLKKKPASSSMMTSGDGFRQISSSKMSDIQATPPEPSSSSSTAADGGEEGGGSNKRQKLENNKQQAKIVDVAAQKKPKFSMNQGPGVKRDFFGRVVQSKIPSTESNEKRLVGDTSSSAPAKHDFTFRFNEGLTDAVRRVVRIQDLL